MLLWGLTADFLLPAHLVVEVIKLLEEVVDLAALVVTFRAGEDAHLRLHGQVLADVGHREHQLLHAAVVTHDLDTRRTVGLYYVSKVSKACQISS